jgi:hypothetical protein
MYQTFVKNKNIPNFILPLYQVLVSRIPFGMNDEKGIRCKS